MKDSQVVPRKWFQIVIDDSLNQWGEGIWDILERVSNKICAKFGVMEHLEGQPKKGRILGYLELEEMQWEPVEVGELLRMVESIGDLDWGDFYLFQKEPSRWEWELNEALPQLVGASDTTVRVVDGNLFYIHTPSREVVDMIRETYGSVESIQFSELDFHTYPY